MRVLAEIDRRDGPVPEMVLIVDVRHFGLVGRDDAGRLFLVDGMTSRESTGALPHARPLKCGPSFLTLLDRFPEGDLPVETARAIFDLVRVAPRPASLARLRYDVEARRFRWDLPSVAREAPPSRAAESRWQLEVVGRLLGRVHGVIRPSLARLFGHTRTVSVQLPDVSLDEGERHLSGIVESVLSDEVTRSRELVEQWRLAEGVDSLDEAKGTELLRKAEALAAEAEHELLRGRPGSARMNMKLATIYGGEVKRYRAALAALEGIPDEPSTAPWGGPDD